VALEIELAPARSCGRAAADAPRLGGARDVRGRSSVNSVHLGVSKPLTGSGLFADAPTSAGRCASNATGRRHGSRS
jgi:hypothetical protein